MAAEITTKAAQPSQATIAVHGGQRTEERPFGAVTSPVFHSATFGFQSLDEMRRALNQI